MRYELLLLTMTPGTPYEAARVDALLAERRGVARPDGVRVWSLMNGDVEVGEPKGFHLSGRFVLIASA